MSVSNRFSSVGIKGVHDWIGVLKTGVSMPNDFGPILWEHLQSNVNSLHRFSKTLFNSNSWEEYINEGLCPYCGKFDVGSPVQIRGDIFHKVELGKIAPDEDAKFHKHTTHKPKLYSQDESLNGLWIDWVYLINPESYALEVLKAVRSKGKQRIEIRNVFSMQNNYEYRSLGFFNLFREEPDWWKIRRKGLSLSGFYYKKYGEHVQSSENLSL